MHRNESDSQLNEPVNLNVATKNFAQGFCLTKDSGTDCDAMSTKCMVTSSIIHNITVTT